MSRADVAAQVRRGIPALAPLAALYGAGVALARGLGMRRRAAPPPGVRIIAVGNLEAGGSGKTPLALHLLERARAAGVCGAYVSRGWGGRAVRAGGVTIVLPEAGAFPDGLAGARVVERGGVFAAADEIGDEAALAVLQVPEAIVAVARLKHEAVRAAAAMGAATIVVDDAFQSWRLARTLDVVLLDATEPLGPGRLLPAGTLREKPSALRRADVVVFNGAADAGAVAAARARVARWVRADARVLGMRRSLALRVASGDESTPLPPRVLAASGVARPDRFLADLSVLGITPAGTLAFPDHHAFTSGDAARIERAARAAAADAVVVTEKDWVKLGRFSWDIPVHVARLNVELVGAPGDAGI